MLFIENDASYFWVFLIAYVLFLCFDQDLSTMFRSFMYPCMEWQYKSLNQYQ